MALPFVLRSTKHNGNALTPLQLSINILQLVKYIDNDADNTDEMALFNVLKEDGEAKKCHLEFLYTIQQRVIYLQDDDDLLEEALMETTKIKDDIFQLLFQTPTRWPQ